MPVPQRPNFEWLVNSEDKKIAEMIPVPMEFVKDVEDLLISKGCEHIKLRRDQRDGTTFDS